MTAAPNSCPPKLLKLFPKTVSQRLLSKATPQSCRSSRQLFVKTAKPQSCSPKLLFKVATESRVPKKLPKTPKLFPEAVWKLLPKAATESCSPKLFVKLPAKAAPQRPKLLLKAVPQSTSAKRLRQSGYASNLFPKAAPHGYSPRRFLKGTPQSCCRKLLPKAAVLQSCRAKLLLLPKAAPQSYATKLFPKAKLLSKAAPDICPPSCQSCPGKLFPKAASQSCFLKLLPKAVVFQSNCSSMLLQSRKVAPHSCSPKLLFKVATESRVPKKLPKTPKLFPEAVWKLLPKAAPRSCS